MIVPLAKTDEMWRGAVAGMDKPDAAVGRSEGGDDWPT
jgi:hypothetical protein